MSRPLKPKDSRKLDEIDEVIDSGDLDTALQESLAFIRKRPQVIEGWEQLSLIAYTLDSDYYMWLAMRQLCQLDPHYDNYRYNFAVVSLKLGFVFLARQAVDTYLKRFPHGLYINQIIDLKQMLNQAMQELINDNESLADVGINDMALFETGNLLTTHGEYAEGRKLSLQAAKKLPGNPSPMNNVALSYMMEGNLTRALHTTDDVLASHSDNVFARSTKVQLLVRLGRDEEARSLLDELHQASPSNNEYWVKIMEACAYAHEHQLVIEVYKRALDYFKKVELPPMLHLHHLAGTAYAFLGETRKANSAWKKALQADPDYDITLQNMDQFREHGPWYFPFLNWLPRVWLQEFANAEERGMRRSGHTYRREIDRLFTKIPALKKAVSLLLERGDPEGVNFVLELARDVPVPGLVEFALGSRGIDKQRMGAAQIAAEHGLLPRTEPVTLIVDGKPRKLLLHAFVINHESVEPDDPLPEAALDHLEAAYEAYHDNDPETVLQEVKRGLSIAPGTPALLNYKAGALHMLNRHDEANAVNRQLAEDNPDYLFARTAMADICIHEDQLDDAEAWLNPLLNREHFHFSEFRALALSYIQFWKAKGEIAGAKYWIQMLDEMDPDTVPDELRETVTMFDVLNKLKTIGRKKK